MQNEAIDTEEKEIESSKSSYGFLEKISFSLVFILPLLVPLFFMSTNVLPFQFAKMLVFSIVIAVAFVCWILSRLKDGTFIFPANLITLGAALVLLVSTISAFFSGSIGWSLAGQSFELGTVASLAVLFLLFLLVSIYLRKKENIFYAYSLFLGSFLVIAVFELLRLIFGPSFLSFGVFNDVITSTLGKWNDLGIFFGTASVLALITLELISLSKIFRVFAYIVLTSSLFFLAVINLNVVWYILAVFSLSFLVYVISFEKKEGGSILADTSEKTSKVKRIPNASLVVLIISLVFIGDSLLTRVDPATGVSHTFISEKISNFFNISQFEVRPSWAATYSVSKSALAVNPLLGSGPNKFSKDWASFKPDGINSSIFWNTDFDYAVGLVPTMMISTGILGSISWLLFFGVFLYWGFRALFSTSSNKISRYLSVSSFLVSLFLWIINIFYVPGLSIVALTFFFTGLFVSSLYQSGLMKPKVLSFTEDPKKGFISVLLLIILLVCTITFSYALLEKTIATLNYQKSIVAFNSQGDLDKAEVYLQKAASVDGLALYYRTLAQIDIARMSTLLSQDVSAVSTDVLQTKFQGYLTNALNNAQQAIKIDPSDYQNIITLGKVYETVVPLKIAGAYENAQAAYKQALVLNPKNPSINLFLAQLEVVHANNKGAKDYIAEALKQKNNYTEAIFLLAQIQVSEGDIKNAITSVQAASYLSPSDSGLLFQLGFLRYNVKDYAGAATALEQAIAINSNYANAQYFLGLSYYHLDKVPEAIAQFKALKITNPDNKEIDLILKNLSAGKDPFANATPPIDSKPEKRSTLPVTEKAPADEAAN
ncbi:MAG: tetratricopeptide repeat protein [Patescibacteria group bacterium]